MGYGAHLNKLLVNLGRESIVGRHVARLDSEVS